jgi:amino acid adenylation domain-containing protein
VGTNNVDDIYELSPLQQGMLLHSVHDGATDMYLSQQTYTAEGALDPDALVQAWQAVVAAHPALRTSFHWEGLDKPLQVVHRDVSLPVYRHDWSDVDEEQQQKRLDQLRIDDRAAGVDLAVPPLQRLNLIRLGDDRHRITWTYHHLLLDGWSVPIFMNDVISHYRCLAIGGPPPPPAPPYRDYIAWLQRQDLEATKSFWVNILAGATPSRLAPLRPWDPQRGTGPVDRRIVRLPARVGRGLRETAAHHRVTFSTVVQAAWAIVLRRYTGQAEVTFGCASSGRPAELPQVDRMVGMFANTLPVRVTVPDDGDLGSWLRDIQGMYAQMRRYEYTPLADIKKWVGAPGRQLFESLLVLENYSLAVDTDGVAEQLTFRQDALYDKVSFPLTLTITPEPVSELQLLIHRERFDPGFVDDVLARLHATFEAMMAAGRIAVVASAAGPMAAPPATHDEALSPAPATGGRQSMPATPLEETIAGVYREILGVTQVDFTTSFFELGGDSFDAVRAISRIDGATVGMLAANPSVRQLAGALAPATAAEPAPGLDDEIAELERLLAVKRAEKAQLAEPRGVVPVPRDGALVCTYQQEGVWFMHQFNSSSTVYHVPFALRLHGSLDVPALERALHALVVRHEALRTRFVNEGGLPRQVIDPPPATMPLPMIDLAADQVEQWAAGECNRPFDLAAGPVFRVAVARLAPDEHALVLVFHHIVADGWSARILGGELSALYAAAVAGCEPDLPPLHVQPADYAAWQRRWLDGAEMQRQIGYWRDTLAGLSTVDFSADRPRPAQPTGAGAAIARWLPAEVATAAHAYARTHQVSLLAVLQAALLTVLHRYTGQHDLPIGSIFSGRTRTDIEPMVGFFGNTLVLRTDLSGDPTFADLVRRCHNTVLDATTHQDVAFNLVVDALRPERVAGRNPLFQIGLTLLPLGIGGTDATLGDVTAEPIIVPEQYALFDISVDIADTRDGQLELSIEYSTELFDADRMHRLMDHFATALANGLTTPDTPAGDIELMTTAERHQVLHAVGYPAEPQHRIVAAAAARTPDAIAVIDHDGTTWTYRQLDAAANQLAHRLRRHGVGPDVPVGICLHRGADLVTALLATGKAGGGYVPLDPDLPPDRLALMLADAPLAVVVTHTEHAPMFESALALDAERAALAAEPTTAADGGATLDDLACVLYTSGSTGTPKGVLVSHRVIHKQIAWLQDTYRLQPADRVLQKTPYGFDVSVWEFFWPLVTGATLVLAAPGGHRDPEYLHGLIARHRVTTMHFVPTMLQAFLDAVETTLDPGALGSLRQVFSSGEALPADTMHRFLAACPDVELHNLWGSTETFDVTAWHGEPGTTVVPIGRPIADSRTYVLDERLRPVPIGMAGQLFVAGTALAHGYLNRPALTAERFLPDPYTDLPGQRMYATGDLVRWRSDGLLEYLGRSDRQVKLRGQRIELGDIEHALAHHPKVRRCAVMLRDNAYLAAYLIGEPDHGDPDPTELRRYLADRLPTYMIPAALVTLPELPLTPNGKLDTARLPDPTPPTTEHTPPRTDTESWLATAWQNLLGVEQIGVGDNFFDLGGNSLHATQLVARIRDILNIHLNPRHLFSNPTLEQLASRLDETPAGNHPGR